MSLILAFSVQNRQSLTQEQQEDPSKVTPATATNRHPEEPILFEEGEMSLKEGLNFKKKATGGDKAGKNESLPLVRKARGPRMSILERTLGMKQYFLKNLHLEDHHIEQMMNLRETILRKKESASLIELNRQLENNQLTQE